MEHYEKLGTLVVGDALRLFHVNENVLLKCFERRKRKKPNEQGTKHCTFSS